MRSTIFTVLLLAMAFAGTLLLIHGAALMAQGVCS